MGGAKESRGGVAGLIKCVGACARCFGGKCELVVEQATQLDQPRLQPEILQR